MPLFIHGVGGSDGGGTHVGNTAPTNPKMLWIDTGNNNVAKYYNGTAWVPIPSTWG